ncbi:MAG: Crp/Fnr family transcriptional regulator [Phenylobacterium sp. RIFCSPHIGHO2_01_FULL_69_31]|jgi:CRP-like cAMP-binding protein|uniref:Crp/Fnr family transcriptional regulator n=1 Tax=Phenylobacterium sp. RIFCSPHIGHO2_01_FULL_69_31 TaxID=1801944 RepID=UPI0008B09D19|nr:Crp/Fnr family transcriptional regulator [Phenylobacterium sp. RIFCSPHIGHO2_01_FULL_69_31]OHB31506.1 MAG: Crp/Fnr family transcriptional regulator [Phenylobacterium sp. RIFCSPHIGHO2_01_FULL_69_31]
MTTADLDPSVLAGADMFDVLDAEGRREVLKAGMVRKLPLGKLIFAQGDAGETCHTLLEGRVKIVQTRPDGGQSVIRFIGPGEMYGTVAALMDKPFPADAVAVVDSLEIYWPIKVMRHLMTRFPQVAIRSAASAGNRLFELQSRVGELSGERVEQRIARALARLVRQAGRRTEAGIEIDFPITRQELAEMAGSTLHTVSRTLSAWEDREIIASTRRHVVVRKLHVLLDMADQGAS